ncbi:MAG: tRNA (adenosine(37)-N6)-threonylcarbamoyltransferase complex ATPase subunit type 1 TsaE [Oscillospiraceae bacterium]
MKMEILTNSVDETEAAGEALSRHLPRGSVIAMYGDLGAGKTAFVRGMARGLGYGGRVTSPTFTIVNEYEGTLPLFHFDMYRLSSSDELFDIGWEDYLGRNGICVVEWSENVRDAFDGSEITISIEKLSEDGRKITVEGEL